MANTEWSATMTRPHWGGAASDQSIHLEVYDAIVESKFQYNAMFRSLSTQRSVADKSNTYRFDRLAGSVVSSRTAGVALEGTRVTSDKAIITVTSVLYVRHEIDYQDDWTAPDYLSEMATNDASAMAETFDTEHIVQLQLCRGFTPAAHLQVGGAFWPGIEVVIAQKLAPAVMADYEANANALVAGHDAMIQTLITRKIPLSDMVTIVTPDVYSALKYHPKLLNLDFDSTNGGAFGERRVVQINGIPVIESVQFPATGYVTKTQGSAYTVLAADAACEMIVFSKSKALLTVEAKSFTSRVWDDPKGFATVLDCFAMYTVGQRRPDYVAVGRLNRA